MDVKNLRVLHPYVSSPDDLARARSIEPTACPRRYCWWWVSLGFEWELPVSEGCTFVAASRANRVDPDWPQRESPCRRSEPSSGADHYEPREPHLLEDGFDILHWKCPGYESR